MLSFTAATAAAALALVFVCVFAAGDADARKNKRFGIEGEIVEYDEATKSLTVKVLETNVAGAFGASNNLVGGKAPGDIKNRRKTTFAVEPEGSVLRRTVIKAMTGGGLDTTGTKEGFKKALTKVPTDRPLVMSLESNAKDAVQAGAPKYKILLIQIPFTEDELRRRWEEISVEE